MQNTMGHRYTVHVIHGRNESVKICKQIQSKHTQAPCAMAKRARSTVLLWLLWGTVMFGTYTENWCVLLTYQQQQFNWISFTFFTYCSHIRMRVYVNRVEKSQAIRTLRYASSRHVSGCCVCVRQQTRICIAIGNVNINFYLYFDIEKQQNFYKMESEKKAIATAYFAYE